MTVLKNNPRAVVDCVVDHLGRNRTLTQRSPSNHNDSTALALIARTQQLGSYEMYESILACRPTCVSSKTRSYKDGSSIETAIRLPN